MAPDDTTVGRTPISTLHSSSLLAKDLTLNQKIARLSPLVFEHINLLGRYAFSVPEAVTRGELRPLRNPDEALEEVP
jgi:hypothetical protein